MPERNAEAQDRGGGIVDILVELLGPQAHSGAAVGIPRRQRRLRIGLVEIFENDVRFRDDLLAIDEGRHHGAAVEFWYQGCWCSAARNTRWRLSQSSFFSA